MTDLTLKILKVLLSDADCCEDLYQFYTKYDHTKIIIVFPFNFVILGYKSGVCENSYKIPESLNTQLIDLIGTVFLLNFKLLLENAIQTIITEYKDLSLIKGAAADEP